MKLRAGSLYSDILVLYNEERTKAFVVQIIDEKIQWDIYCNEVELVFEDNSPVAKLFYGDVALFVPVWEIDIRDRVSESIRIANDLRHRQI